jgi:Membrane bound FAD containing D-sorbitol dehydrogenase
MTIEQPNENNLIPRREFLERAAATSLAILLWPGLADATTELWEEGDPLCQVAYPSVTPDYDLDLAFLNSFLALSQTLTDVAPLDRHLANQFMERCATNAQVSKTLPQLISAYREIAPNGTRPSDADVQRRIMSDATLSEGAKQLIYLWYISAFFLPRPEDASKRMWVYGTPEQYRRALMWAVIRAHAPMTPGGPPGHWAFVPPNQPV